MNNLTTRQADALARSSVPSFSEATGTLGSMIRTMQREVSIHHVPEDVQQAAWQHLHAIEPLCAPSTFDQMMSWMGKLARSVCNAPTNAAELQKRYEGIWEVCGDLPCAVWCDETRKGWVRKLPEGKYWPQPGELYDHLNRFATDMKRDRAGCEAILAAAGKVQRDEWTPPTEADHEAVRTLMRAWRANKADTQRTDRATLEEAQPLQPYRRMTREELLETFREGARDALTPELRNLARVRAEGLQASLDADREAEANAVRYG